MDTAEAQDVEALNICWSVASNYGRQGRNVS